MKQIDQAAILDHLLAQSREPFTELLSRFLFYCPTDESLFALANTKPAEWAKAMTQIAKLAGYHDKLEVSGTINHIHELGDAALMARLAEARARREAGYPSESARQKESEEPKPPAPLLLTYQPLTSSQA